MAEHGYKQNINCFSKLYNDIFAPGWTIASLWELYSPNRTTDFLK